LQKQWSVKVSEVTVQSIDQLGLVAGMIEELEIITCIDETIPTEKKISHGTAVASLLLNGLGFANKQLYLTPRFFKKKAITHFFGDDIKPEYLNKETLSRSLDAIYEYGVSELYEKIACRAVGILGLSCSVVHLDSTSFHVDGVYNSQEEKEEGVVHITKGYSRDHHPNLNQVILNLIVEHQAGIPLMMRAADGNQIDAKAFVSIVDEHIDALKALENTKLTLIADAALFTQKGLKVIKEKEIHFVSRVPMRLREAHAMIDIIFNL
jgi:transposase